MDISSAFTLSIAAMVSATVAPPSLSSIALRRISAIFSLGGFAPAG